LGLLALSAQAVEPAQPPQGSLAVLAAVAAVERSPVWLEVVALLEVLVPAAAVVVGHRPRRQALVPVAQALLAQSSSWHGDAPPL
jgi:hypothetical protein